MLLTFATRRVPRLALALAAAALALSACVPIPVAQRNYVPNSADTASKVAWSGGCSMNNTSRKAVTDLGAVRTETYVTSDATPGALTMRLAIHQGATNGRFSSVAVSPGRIALTENGRTLTAKLLERTSGTYAAGQSRWTQYTLRFAKPSGVADTLRIDMPSGAIRVGGTALPASSVRYELNTSPQVYMFPCIPT